jgi:hypothetical protein
MCLLEKVHVLRHLDEVAAVSLTKDFLTTFLPCTGVHGKLGTPSMHRCNNKLEIPLPPPWTGVMTSWESPMHRCDNKLEIPPPPPPWTGVITSWRSPPMHRCDDKLEISSPAWTGVMTSWESPMHRCDDKLGRCFPNCLCSNDSSLRNPERS